MGADIRSLRVEFTRRQRFRMEIDAQLHPGRDDAPFVSEDLWDADFLRHIGLLKAAGQP